MCAWGMGGPEGRAAALLIRLPPTPGCCGPQPQTVRQHRAECLLSVAGSRALTSWAGVVTCLGLQLLGGVADIGAQGIPSWAGEESTKCRETQCRLTQRDQGRAPPPLRWGAGDRHPSHSLAEQKGRSNFSCRVSVPFLWLPLGVSPGPRGLQGPSLSHGSETVPSGQRLRDSRCLLRVSSALPLPCPRPPPTVPSAFRRGTWGGLSGLRAPLGVRNTPVFGACGPGSSWASSRHEG